MIIVFFEDRPNVNYNSKLSHDSRSYKCTALAHSIPNTKPTKPKPTTPSARTCLAAVLPLCVACENLLEVAVIGAEPLLVRLPLVELLD